MRVSILGAGPAGLYLAILLRKADPRHEITVVERNPPDATFGWGVVFSEETLGALRDADPQSYADITDTFARWDTVDIRYQCEPMRSRGHTFSAIARKRLLAILQRRCRELGVRLRFGVEVTDAPTADPSTADTSGAATPTADASTAATSTAADALDGDLVVAADGVNSVTRRGLAQQLGSVVEPQGCKYVWFGTDLVFDAFTFIFRETEFGLFQVHAYPFDEHTSTFIVECPESVWRRAGLDRCGEQESMAFCQRLFADELAGHRLLSNRSVWLSFMRVSNESWHHGNTVLLGDAAHTAHFSIGSGTKLAMEDSIALANALARHQSLPDALVEYELERAPVVERFQQAADESAAYFGRVGNYTNLEPLQFAFNLLTRSGRISHGNLSLRDPEFMRELDGWFAGGAAIAPPPMFVPLQLGELSNREARPAELGGQTIRNRVVRPADTPQGAGVALTDLIAVSPEGRVSPKTATLCGGADVERLREQVKRAHDAGALLAVRLGHAGRRGATRPPEHGVDIPLPEQWPLLSASALPYGPRSATPKAMDAGDMIRVREAFTSAVRRALEAGCDLLELDMAHGHLLASFLSPLTNRRDDGYGHGARFPLEVLRAVREAWRGPLLVRLTVDDWAPGGLSLDDGVELARQMAAGGADVVHVEAGQTVPEGRPQYRRGYLTPLSDRVRSEARVPTLVGGYLTTRDEVNTVIAAGRADLCLLELP
jgi:anthraniloyl-CoA monooxygenase